MRLSETGFGVFVESAMPWMAAVVVATAALIICLWRGGVLDTPAPRDPSRWLIGAWIAGTLGALCLLSGFVVGVEASNDLGKARALREAVASRSDINDTLAESLFDDPALEVRAATAANTRSAAVLVKAATDTATDVRAAAAANPATPPEALAVLASDPEHIVRLAVVTNPAAPSEVLAAVVSESYPSTAAAAAAAADPATSPDLLRILTRHNDPTVRAAAAANPETPSEVAAADGG